MNHGEEMVCSAQGCKEGSLTNIYFSLGKKSQKCKHKKERELDSNILEEVLSIL